MSVSSGFTKTGFSRSFSCCSQFDACDFGKSTCFYDEKDPEVKLGCKLWLRNQENKDTENTLLPLFSDKEIESELDSEPVNEQHGQLSLFD